MITSLIETLELSNFGYITAFTIKLPHNLPYYNKIKFTFKFAGEVMDKNYDVTDCISKYH